MKRSRLLSVVVIAAVYLAPADLGGRGQTSFGTASIRGTVTARDNTPLSGVEVRVTSPKGITITTDTDQRGAFQVRGVQAGLNKISVRRPGFVSTRRSTTEVNMSVPDGGQLDNVHFELVATSAIHGRLVDDASDPRQGVHVEALRYEYPNGRKRLAVVSDDARTVETNEKGEFRLYGLLPGEYYLRFSPGILTQNRLDRFSPVFFPGVQDIETASKISIKEGMDLSLGDARVLPSRTFSLRVHPVVQGDPAAGRHVLFSVTPSHSNIEPVDEGFQARQAGGGTYVIDGLDSRTYDVYAWAPGERGIPLQFAKVTIDLQGRDMDLGLLPLKAAKVLHGRLRFNTRPPTQTGQLEVRLFPDEAPPMANLAAAVRSDGTFEIPDVPDGAFHVSVRNLSPTFYLESTRYGGRNAADASLVISDNVEGPLDLEVAEGPVTISGTVSAIKSEAIRGATIVLIPAGVRQDYPGAYRTFLAASGSFVFTGVPLGEYSLLAWEYLDVDAYYDPAFVARYSNYAVPIRLNSSGAVTVNVRLIPAER